MNNIIEKYSGLANSALESIFDQRWRTVAILANKKPISIAVNNLSKTHPMVDRFNSNRRMHAELSCLIRAPKEKIVNSTMYIWRFGHSGLLLSRPCEMCFQEMLKSGVKRVVYSTNNGDFAESKI